MLHIQLVLFQFSKHPPVPTRLNMRLPDVSTHWCNQDMLIHHMHMCILGVTYLVNDLPRKIVGFPSQILCDPGVGILRGILCGFGTRILYYVISKWDFVFFFWNQDPGVGIL